MNYISGDEMKYNKCYNSSIKVWSILIPFVSIVYTCIMHKQVKV